VISNNTKVKKLYEAAKKVFEIGKCARKTFKGVMENEANPFKVDNSWKNSEKIKRSGLSDKEGPTTDDFLESHRGLQLQLCILQRCFNNGAGSQ